MQRLRAAPAHPSNVLPAFLVSAAPRFCGPSLRLASFLSASATLTGHTLVLAVIPGEDSGVLPSPPRLSFQLSPLSSLTQDPPAVPRPSPHPVPLQHGLPGGLTHLLWAPAFLRRCCAHLAESCWHPPSASARPPSPRLPPVLAARPASQGPPDPPCHLLKDSSSLSSPFPPSLHSRLHPACWLSPVGLQTCVLSTPSPSPLVLQKVWLWSLSPVFLSGFLPHARPVQALALTPPPCQDHL